MSTTTAATSEPIARKYALLTLSRLVSREMEAIAGGKYLLYSNDGTQAFILARYEEDGSAYVEQIDGSQRVIKGTFWRTLRIKCHVADERGWLGYEGEAGRSALTGVLDADAIIDAAVELSPAIEEVDTQLKSRNEAVQAALRWRFKARRRRPSGQHLSEPVWAVYDQAKNTWPAAIGGRTFTAHQDRALAEADADWLNRHHA